MGMDALSSTDSGCPDFSAILREMWEADPNARSLEVISGLIGTSKSTLGRYVLNYPASKVHVLEIDIILKIVEALRPSKKLKFRLFYSYECHRTKYIEIQSEKKRKDIDELRRKLNDLTDE